MAIEAQRLKEIKENLRNVINLGNTYMDASEASDKDLEHLDEELADLAEAGDNVLRDLAEGIEALQRRVYRRTLN